MQRVGECLSAEASVLTQRCAGKGNIFAGVVEFLLSEQTLSLCDFRAGSEMPTVVCEVRIGLANSRWFHFVSSLSFPPSLLFRPLPLPFFLLVAFCALSPCG